MKTFKLNFVLLGFLVFAMTSIFSSCQKDELKQEAQIEDAVPDIAVTAKNAGYAIPAEIGEKGNAAILVYLNSLDEKGWAEAEENYRISVFLVENNLNDRFSQRKAAKFTDIDLSEYLSRDELSKLASFIPAVTEGGPTFPVCNDAYLFYSYHTVHYLCCKNRSYHTCGPIYICSGGTWNLVDGNFCKSINVSCSGSACYPFTVELLNEASYYCNSFQSGEGQIAVEARRALSSFLANELSPKSKSIRSLYIANYDEINGLFRSTDPKHKVLQEKMNRFLTVNLPLIEGSFMHKMDIAIADEHLQASRDLLEEMARVIDNPDLVKELKFLSQGLDGTRGKVIKEVLSTF